MAGTWANLVHQPGASVDTMLLLTDGTVIAHESDSPNWHQLTPDAQGSYTKGTWASTPPMPPNNAVPTSAGGPVYGPLFFGSAMLGDGTLMVVGGEYNTGISVDVAAATRFDPVYKTWTNLATPAGWTNVGDVPLCVLADGRVLLGNLNNSQTALFDPATSAYTAGPNKGDRCAEESFTLLPDDTVLAVDCSAIPQAEKYIPSTNTWVSAGNTPVTLPQACAGIVPEIGPTVVLPSGNAFVIGATGATATYIPPSNPQSPGTWQAGPTIVDGANNTLFPIDAPAALLPNGRVLFAASPAPPCSFPGPTSFFEYDPATDALSAIGAPSNAGGPCFTGRFLLLPNGQVLFSNQSSKVTVYTPDGTPDPAWKPVIIAVPACMAQGHHYLLAGRQFNGLSQACSYGDDATMATNYPVARLEQGGTVIYCRTARHSTMGVATGNNAVDTILSIPPKVPPGTYSLVVVANGIPSDPVPVNIFVDLPAIAVNVENGGGFGTECGPTSLELQIFNVGDLDLIVDKVQAISSSGDFSVASLPSTPVTIKPGAEVEFTITFIPSTPGANESGTIRILSNDPVTPTFDIAVKAIAGAGNLSTAIADHGDFGKVCVGSLRDEPLTLANTGTCKLVIGGVTSSTVEFQPPDVSHYPLTIAAGTAIELPIRFQPKGNGLRNATLIIENDGLGGPHTIEVSGIAPSPRLAPIGADSGNFGKVCIGSFADQQLILSNSGECALSINAISSSSIEFLTPQVLSYPIRIGAGNCLPLPIRFQPTSLGGKTATLSVFSDDPASPATIGVSGEVPSGKIAVTGSTCFGGIPACSCAERVIAICNVGECHLHVTGVSFRRRNRHWKLINNPFPASLHPGSCLNLVIRYKATEECPHSQDLVIRSDDPVAPVKVLDLSAHTAWESCACDDKDRAAIGQGKRRHACDPCDGCGRHACNCCDDDDEEEEQGDRRRDADDKR